MNGVEPLDSTIVHPEKYSVLKSLLSLVTSPPSSSSSPSRLLSESKSLTKKRKKTSSSSGPGPGRQLSNEEIKQLLFTQQLRDRFLHCHWPDLSSQLEEDIDTLKLLSRWITDPLFNSSHDLDLRGRKGIPPLLARKCLLSPEDYQPGLVVQGIVRNITSFGTFLDIGAEEDGFLHRSKYGSRSQSGFVIGEVIRCEVLLIDRERGGKISLRLMEEERGAAALAPILITEGRSDNMLPQALEEEGGKRAIASEEGREGSVSEQRVAKRSRRTKNS
jgi:transcriptional accessory protein Tex/SPT6